MSLITSNRSLIQSSCFDCTNDLCSTVDSVRESMQHSVYSCQFQMAGKSYLSGRRTRWQLNLGMKNCQLISCCKYLSILKVLSWHILQNWVIDMKYKVVLLGFHSDFIILDKISRCLDWMTRALMTLRILCLSMFVFFLNNCITWTVNVTIMLEKLIYFEIKNFYTNNRVDRFRAQCFQRKRSGQFFFRHLWLFKNFLAKNQAGQSCSVEGMLVSVDVDQIILAHEDIAARMQCDHFTFFASFFESHWHGLLTCSNVDDFVFCGSIKTLH